MFCDLLCLLLIKRDFAAGKSHKGELVLGQKLLELCGFEICHGIGPKLYAAKTNRRNIVNRLPLFVAPGDSGVAEADARQAAGRSE